jgi:hypothetical protein
MHGTYNVKLIVNFLNQYKPTKIKTSELT